MATIIDLNAPHYGDIPVENVLEGARHLKMVIVMGYDEEGEEYFASSSGKNEECAWLAQRYVKLLLDGSDYYMEEV